MLDLMILHHRFLVPALLVAPLLGACRSGESAVASDDLRAPPPRPPIAGLEPADELIQPDETHFAKLWRVTRGGENAEGYWSPDGSALVLQRRAGGLACDQIFVTEAGGKLRQISSGRGVTTCAYFLPDNRHVLFASTQSFQDKCPEPPDMSEGYVWLLRPEFDLWLHDLRTGAERRLTETWGYDAEATISPLGDRMVFTSTRSGDPELYTCDLDGRNVVRVTHAPGYDGGAFFSHDGKRLVFRATAFAPDGQPGDRAQFLDLVKRHKVRPHAMDLYVCDADGSERKQLTRLPGASFAPYFFPDDQRVIFSSNWEDPAKRNFDIYAVGLDGGGLERITTHPEFDSFPMFSPDGRYLVFASNRGASERGETNLFVALWRG